jgi:hypothetical protein
VDLTTGQEMDNSSITGQAEPVPTLMGEFPTATRQQWQQQAEQSLKGKPVAKLRTKTYEQIECEPIYFREDATALNFLQNLPANTLFCVDIHFPARKCFQLRYARTWFSPSPRKWAE